jgi:hypothetical protein
MSIYNIYIHIISYGVYICAHMNTGCNRNPGGIPNNKVGWKNVETTATLATGARSGSQSVFVFPRICYSLGIGGIPPPRTHSVTRVSNYLPFSKLASELTQKTP